MPINPVPCVPIDARTRVAHVRTQPAGPGEGDPKVVVRYYETGWGDARPRPMQVAYFPRHWT